jgi:hypothetical protein
LGDLEKDVTESPILKKRAINFPAKLFPTNPNLTK